MNRKTVLSLALFLFISACAQTDHFKLARNDPGPLPDDIEAFVHAFLVKEFSTDEEFAVRISEGPQSIIMDYGLVGGGEWAVHEMCVVVEFKERDFANSFPLHYREGKVVTHFEGRATC